MCIVFRAILALSGALCGLCVFLGYVTPPTNGFGIDSNAWQVWLTTAVVYTALGAGFVICAAESVIRKVTNYRKR